jgi:hypothetical protein
MARTVQVHLLDDIDGSAADETLVFALDGTTYEIDLTSAHAKELRAALEGYVTAGRRVARGTVANTTRSRAVTPARSDRDQNQAIRDWAKRQKIELSSRGRIPRAIVEQYEAAAGR